MNITTIDGIYENGRYRLGYEIRMKCHQGFYFADGTPEKQSQCVDLGDNKLEWTFVDSCYPGNYLKFIQHFKNINRFVSNGELRYVQ